MSTQTTYVPPDWGAALNAIDAALAADPASDIISYSIGGRQFTKSRDEVFKQREFVLGEYNRTIAGSSVTYANMNGSTF